MYFFMDKKRTGQEKKRRCYQKKTFWALFLTGVFLLQITVSVPVLISAKESVGPITGESVTVSAQGPAALYSTAAVLMDADTGRVLFSKDGDVFMANASTTKILTCIVALENASLDEVVEVSAYAASMPKVKLYIKAGEHYRLEDLLYSLMLESHNDSAVAIAEHVGGSMEEFADMMNEKAAEIGCTNSYFITPNGLDATESVTDAAGNITVYEHGTTAEDLAKIMAYCAFESPQKEMFLQITRSGSYSFTNEEGRSFSCTNHNAFLTMMEGALTGKTGFTNKAGYCYVGALERDGKRFTIALLACGWPNNKTWKWADARTLFSYGLENYEYKSIEEVAIGEIPFQPIPVVNGQTDSLDGETYTAVEIVQGEGVDRLLLEVEEEIEIYWETQKVLQAPVYAGEQVGYIRYTVGEEILREDKIITVNSVAEIDFVWCLMKVLEKYVL